jgi:hypothetical protein
MMGPLQVHQQLSPDGPAFADQEVLEQRFRLEAVPSQDASAVDYQCEWPKNASHDIGAYCC